MKCNIHGELTIDEIYECITTKRGKPFLSKSCKKCAIERSKLYKKRNREEYNRKCRLNRKKNPEKYKEYEKKNRLRNKELFGDRENKIQIINVYKLKISEYEELFSKHKNLCAICKNSEIKKSRTPNEICKLGIDHCHKCEENGIRGLDMVRGLLCHSCNTGLGKFKDDPELLLKAIDYLNSHKHIE